MAANPRRCPSRWRRRPCSPIPVSIATASSLAAGLARNAIVDRALAVLDGVDPKGAFADAAMNQRIDILLNADREPEALALASARAEAKTAAVADWQRYADLLVTTNDPVAAARWYGKVVAANDATWSAWLQYGGALDQAGRWPEARVALARAVAQAPTEPLALNYLGFAQIEHGDDIAASTGMLERASRLDPQNASITDSLGWAYHLSGRTPRALPLLERAAQAEPTSMEISDHLGDAYWTVGRRYEARYAWRAASLTAEAKDMPRIADKIANGLPGAARR
ncbi:tetratricopeptide repeat protein [Sphingomonas sp. 22R3R2A-7]|uniref:tetratricopeptide repeat protein n=1 Tax=Sphingomonas sp. 22R3R2A-7 TaxID=3050230 RepID=UPI002FE2486D